MGMDVYGKSPTTKRGEYFRNNVWGWRPLWNYCILIANDLIDENVANGGHFNSGVGLDADGAKILSEYLFQAIASGSTEAYKLDYDMRLSKLERVTCEWCAGSGIRTDEVGQDMGQPTRVLEPELQILLGREFGWCNGCGGEGTKDPWERNYPFEVENVREFAEFLADCGGFEIC